MPEFGYSFVQYNEVSDVRGSLREVDVSPKEAREVANYIKGMSLDRAKQILQEVIEKKRIVPFKRYHRKVAHHKVEGFYAGRYPVKAAKYFLKLLENLESNALYKGLDVSRLIIIHTSAYPGRKLVRYIPRAFGRRSPKRRVYVHIEAVARVV
ncbi:MAG: 50S ribosomal protein L22 [Thaumarchaeota archaeon]|jgi:large subunit ribosomal protein L22|nr:50S ribosomal protein L22 [Nitrososphaerota archaeon]